MLRSESFKIRTKTGNDVIDGESGVEDSASGSKSIFRQIFNVVHSSFDGQKSEKPKEVETSSQQQQQQLLQQQLQQLQQQQQDESNVDATKEEEEVKKENPEIPQPPPQAKPAAATTTTTTTTTSTTSTTTPTKKSKNEDPKQEQQQQVLKPDDGSSAPPKLLTPVEKPLASEEKEIQSSTESIGPGFICREKDMGPRTGKKIMNAFYGCFTNEISHFKILQYTIK